MLLSDGAINWIDMPENKVHFYIAPALVRSKHDGVGCFVIELQIYIFGGCLWFSLMFFLWWALPPALTVVSSSVSFPADRSFRYEPPHSWPSYKSEMGKRQWKKWVSKRVLIGFARRLMQSESGSAPERFSGWMGGVIVPATWPRTAPPAACLAWNRRARANGRR